MSKTTILIVLLMILLVAAAFFNEQRLENQKKEEVKNLVDNAALLIQEKGESAFPELRSSSWQPDDLYVFVWRLDGIRVVYPPDVSGEGKNMTDLKDAQGKPIGKLFIQTAENGSGWVEYYWPKPGETQASQKITYIKRVHYGNQTYLVGAGFYI
jgi:signal transduction histidine kinase